MTDPNTQPGAQFTPEQQALLNPELDLPPDIGDLVIPDDVDEPASETIEEPEATVEEPVEEPVVEAAPEPTSEPTPAPQPDLRIDRALLDMEKRQREMMAREQEAERKLQQAQDAIRAQELLASGDRLGAMDALGLRYEDVTDDYIQGKGPNQMRKLENQLAKQREEMQSELQKIRAEREQEQAEAFRQSVINFSKTSEEYPHIAATSGHDLVYQAVQSHYLRTGQILSNADAAQAVEEGLASLLTAVLGNESLRAKYLGSGATTPIESAEETAVAKQPTTLSNDIATESTVVVDDKFDPITASDEEMIERLASSIEFE